jgi:hypothetical protein
LLTWLIFTCRVQSSLLVEPAQSPSPHFNVKLIEADVVTLTSSDTEEALELLHLSPTHGPHSPLSELRSSSSSRLFDDWPEANNMVVSVFVALTTDALSSHASMASASHCTRKSCANGSSTRQSHTRATPSRRPRRQKYALTSAPRRKSKTTKVDSELTLAAPTPRGGSLSAANFDRSKWEIMYLLFVTKGLIDPSERVSQKDA